MKQLLIVLLAFVGFNAMAQNMPERGEIRKGNRQFDKEDYESALESYTSALTYSPASFEANYNLSNTLQRLEQFDKAEETMAKLAADSLLNVGDRADAYYNLGNSQFGQQKYKEALESYKSSLRLNPSDTTAKYNYAFTKKLLEQQDQDQDQDGDGDGDGEQDQDDQEQNQDGDQNQDQQDQDGDDDQNQDQQDQDGDGDQNQDQQDQDQNGDQGDDDEQQQDQQPQGGGMSEQEQQQILDAIQAQEDKTQEKLNEESGRAIVIPGGKNW